MAPEKSKQWVTAQDGLSNLQPREGEIPQPKDEEVLVKINAVSLNYRDTEVIMGLYGHHRSIQQSQSIVPCSDMCGTVVAPDSKGTWRVGQRVSSIFNQTHLHGQVTEQDMTSGLGLPLPGVLCEHRCFPASSLVAIPDYLTDEEASCLPIASVTAWMAINGFQPLGQPARDMKRSQSVLIQGTGGVAIAGLQIAYAAGFKTIVTSSSDEKLSRAARDLGADVTINYRTNTDWEQAVLDATNGKGADIIFENGGARTLRKSFECVAFGGLINCIGYLSGKEDDPGDRVNTNVLALKRNVTLKGLLNGPKERFEEMLAFYAEHKIKPVVDKIYGMSEAPKALEYLYSGGHFGKVVVRTARSS